MATGRDREEAPAIAKRRATDGIAERPLGLVALFVVLAAGILLTQIWRQAEEIKTASAHEAAEAYSRAVSTTRKFYSDEIVSRARRAGVEITHDYHNKDKAIPLPATLTIDLGTALSREGDNYEVRLYSEYPWARRADRILDTFQLEALVHLQRNPTKPYARFDTVRGQPVYRHATAVIMGESCAECHNSRADSPRHGWKAGDVRGAQEVIVPVHGTAEITFRQLLESGLLLALLAMVALLLMTLLLRGLRRALADSRALASELAGKNSELLGAKADAERANRAKSDFLATISHELRTPLNAILGFSELMEKERLGPIGTPKYREFAAEVHTSGSHLLEIINDILDMSKIEAGKMELREDDVQIADVAAACARMVGDRAKQSGLSFDVDVPDGLPMLKADARAIKQILLNLLANAIKFTPAGGCVTLAARLEPDDGVVLTVADTGIGIAADQLPKIMHPFTQIDSSLTRTHGGTGLGLPIAKALTELHGGTLAISSAPGEGTLVTIALPARRLLLQAA